MQSWIKLYCTVNQSSISQCSYPTRLVWYSMMAICGLDGIARISEDCVARIANVKEEEAKEALVTLSSPDPHSKDPDHEGRRIEKVPGGYRILNYFKYRDIKSPAQRASYMRDYMKEYRQKKKERNSQMTWQESYQNEANDAMTLPIPPEFGADVEGAMIDFLNSRFHLATEPDRKQDRVRLTSAMVMSLFDATRIALITKQPSEVASRLRTAAISGYRSPKLTDLYA